MTYWKESVAAASVTEQPIHDGDGVIKRRSFFGNNVSLPVNFEVWEIAPGASEGDHTHAGAGALEEVYYFQDGEGVVTVEGEEVPVAADDVVLVPAGVDHGVRNSGSTPLRLIILWGKPIPSKVQGGRR